MAQTALFTEQMGFEGMEPKLAYKQVELLVLEQLEQYKRNGMRVKVLQRVSIGNGMHIDVTPQAMAGGKDILSLLQDKLRRMPEEKYLTAHEKELANIWREYMGETNPVSLSSKVRALLDKLEDQEAMAGVPDEDVKLLRELKGRIARTAMSRNQWNRNCEADVANAAVKKVDEQMKARAELNELLDRQAVIDEALEQLGTYDAGYESLIRLRYLQGKSVVESCQTLTISEKTHDRMKKKAIGLMAHLLGITKGN